MKAKYAGWLFINYNVTLELSVLLDGQAIAVRLSRQITTRNLKKAINRFNTLQPDPLEGSAYSLPKTIEWSEVCKIVSIWNYTSVNLAVNCLHRASGKLLMPCT